MGVLAPKLAAAVMLLIFYYSRVTSSTQNPNIQIESVLCNSRVYSKGDPFGLSLDYIVKDLERGTPCSPNYDYFNISPYPNAFAFGHALCNNNKTLTTSDCATCLGAAKSALFSTCPTNFGARAFLSDCALRFEQYPFYD